jgi:hypothetical protein
MKVVLVGLHERLYVLRRHEAHLVALLAQSLAKEMGACAGFHPNQINLSDLCSSKAHFGGG